MEVLKHIRTSFWVLVFLFSSECISQINDVESAYRNLDAFREAPTRQSAASFQKNLELWNATSQDAQLAKVVSYCNLGYYQRSFLQFQDAILSYETAKTIFKENKLSDYDIIGACYVPLGNLYTRVNALSEAENQIKEYILLAQRSNRENIVIDGLSYLAIVFRSQGAHEQAISVLKEAIGLAPENDDLKLNLASSYLKFGAVEAAEIIVRKHLKTSPLGVKATVLLAEIELEKNTPKQALETLKLLIKNLEKPEKGSNRDLARLYLSSASINVQLNDDTAAKAQLQRVYSLFIPTYNSSLELPLEVDLIAENTLMDALDLQAVIYRNQGELVMVYKTYQLAFEVSDLLNEGSFLQDSKIIQANAKKIRSEQCLDVLFELYNEKKDSVWLQEAIQIDQRSKSPILLESRQFQARLKASKDSVLVNKIKQAQFESSVLLKQINSMKNATTLTIDHLEEAQQKYNETTVSLKTLKAQFKQNNPETQNLVSLSRLKDVSILKQQTLVSYFIGKGAIFQFTVSEGEISFVKLANSKEQCSAFLENCAKVTAFFDTPSVIINDPSKYAEQAYQLYKLLSIPEVENLVIIPDGLLSFLPIDALLTKQTNTHIFSDMPFLVRTSSVSYALSPKDFLRTSEPKKFKKSVLGVFPVFEGTNRELSYSLLESEALIDATNAHLLMRKEATVQSFLSNAEKYDLIHISSHAQGGSFTSPAGIEFIDNTLTIDELYGFQFNKELIVLSACETGVGKVVRGEGVQSVARAFQYAGAKNTLFSLWKVNDFTTANLMAGFYHNLNKTGSFNEALHQSKLSFLDNPKLENSKKSPYNWGAFVYYGKTQESAEIRLQSWWLLFLLVPIGFVIFLSKRRYSNM